MNWLTVGGALLVLAGLAWLGRHLYRRFPVGAIYRSKIHLEHAFDSFDDPLAVIDRSYTIRRANHAYSVLVNRPYGAILKNSCYTVLRGRYAPCEDCRMDETLRTRGRQVAERSPHPGHEGTIALAFFPFRPGERSDSIVEHIRDVTELERLRDRLQQKNAELEKTTRDLQQAQSLIMTEIDMAREVQESLLPPKLPSVAGLRIDVAYSPVETVGGDLYDFVSFSPTRLGVFIGDASGHGLPAAFVSTMVKMSLYNHTRQELAPASLMGRVNTDITSNIKTSHYLTCIWCIYDAETRVLTYVRAGHPRPIVVRPDGGQTELDAPGTLIGILNDVSFVERTYQCRSGDRLYLFTDGVYVSLAEGRGENGTVSTEPFEALLSSCASLPFELVMPTMRQKLTVAEREDDYTVVLLEVV